MNSVDRERELIGLGTKQALDQKREKHGEWRKGGGNEKKAAAGLIGAQTAREQARDNDNNRRAKVLASGKKYQAIADQLNKAGFKTAQGKAFEPTQVRRLCL